MSMAVSAKSTTKTTINCWREKFVSVVTLCASYMSMCVHVLDVVCFLSYSLSVRAEIKCAYFMCISIILCTLLLMSTRFTLYFYPSM